MKYRFSTISAILAIVAVLALVAFSASIGAWDNQNVMSSEVAVEPQFDVEGDCTLLTAAYSVEVTCY